MCGYWVGKASADNPSNSAGVLCEREYSAKEIKVFNGQIWDHDLWERGQAKPAQLSRFKDLLACAKGKAHAKAALRHWRALRASYMRYRHYRIVNPYWGCTKLGGCKYWALPVYIVDCESGGDYTPDMGLTFGGAYGLLVSTWIQYGGLKYASQANYARPFHQDIIAKKVWNDVGPQGWACS